MKCDTIATGVITACKAGEPERAAGRAHEGHQRRAGQEDAGRVGLPIIAADTMAEAATAIVACRSKTLQGIFSFCPQLSSTMSISSTKTPASSPRGITGKTGQFHTEKCIDYANGKNCFVAGVNPKKAGEKILDVPIYAVGKPPPRPARPFP